MPTVVHPNAQRAVEKAGKTAQWTKQKIKNIAGGFLAPEERPNPEHRALSPAISDGSTSCDGEDEIFPTVVRVPTAEKEQVKTGIKDAMKESFPMPLHRYMKNEEPGISQRKKNSRRGKDDVITKKQIGNGEAWKGEMSLEAERRWKELQKEWQQKDERNRDDEENKVMESITGGMFVSTLELHLQASKREEGVMEDSGIRKDRLGFVVQPVQGVSRGDSSENNSKSEHLDQLRRERHVPQCGEPRAHAGNSKENASAKHEHSSRRSKEPQNIRQVAEAAARMNQPKRVSEREEQQNQRKNTQDKGKQVEDSSDDDVLHRRKREFRGKLFPDEEEEMPFAPIK